MNIPQSDTEELNSESLIQSKRPPITGYRILVTASAISFGMTKAALSYRGFETVPTTIEWIYGVVVTLLCVSRLHLYFCDSDRLS